MVERGVEAGMLRGWPSDSRPMNADNEPLAWPEQLEMRTMARIRVVGYESLGKRKAFEVLRGLERVQLAVRSSRRWSRVFLSWSRRMM